MEFKTRYPLGIQTFEEIIQEGYVYVDKTALVYRLVKTGKVYFLSRPRRFGKSLLVSTLVAYFEGKKDLFNGLAIDKLEKDWVKYPVLWLDLNAKNFTTEAALIKKISFALDFWEEKYNVPPKKYEEIDDRFQFIIRQVYEQTGKKVVVLIDEYDKPMLEVMDNEKLTESYRRILRGFYGVLKSSDEYLKFVFLTGVTKFAKLSIFSDLNQLEDISLDEEYDTLCGITKDELVENFGEGIETLSAKLKVSTEETLEKLKKMYDGYHFSEALHDVYNPYSLLRTFKSSKIRDYWFQTGTPTFLYITLQKTQYNITDLEGVRVPASDLTNYRPDDFDPIPMFYQSGYLTIKAYDEDDDVYTLTFPNNEVHKGFIQCINKYYFPQKPKRNEEARLFWDDLQKNDVESFMKRFQSFVASIDYRLFNKKQYEKDYQFIFVLVFTLMGLDTKPEVHTSNGSMDAVIYTDTHIYIFEFKLDKTAAEALQQIEEKRYADQFLTDGRKIVKIGANFSSEKRSLEKWQVVE